MRIVENVAVESVAFPVIAFIWSTEWLCISKTVPADSGGRKNDQIEKDITKPTNNANINRAMLLCWLSIHLSEFQFLSFFSSIFIAPWTT